jgi:stage V sporulation protein SpoVS
MRSHTDPMQRLAAADPLRDGERLTPEEEREAEALLTQLLATAPAVGVGRRRVRRWTLAAAGAAGAVAAVLAATSLIDSKAPGAGIVERAVAAVSQPDVVYHVVERSRADVSYAPEATTLYIESWHTSDGRIHQRTYAAEDGRRGKLMQDFAGVQIPGRRVNPVLMWDASTDTISEAGFGPGPDTGAPVINPFNEPGAQLRALEAEGRLRVAGETLVEGKRAYRLVSGPVDHPHLRNGEERAEYLVDADTYIPLERTYESVHRSTDPEHPISRIEITGELLVYERLPLTDENRALLDLDPHPGAKCSDFAHELTGKQGVGFPNPCARPE